MSMEERFQVGIITSSHGVRGEMKIFPTTDDAKRFKKLKEVILDTGKEEVTIAIEGVKFSKQMVILKLKGIDSPEEAEKYRQKSLYVTRKNAVRLSKDEYFIADLIGLEVRDEQDKKIGEMKDVIQTGANDVYVIEMTDGKELLLPAIRECVLKVDVEGGFMNVHVMEGLLDSDQN